MSDENVARKQDRTTGPRGTAPTHGLRGVTPAQQMALVAMFAAIISVCAIAPAFTVGAIPAPITLQTFGVMLTAMILGPRLAPLAVGLYLVVGALGLPVFAKGASGLAVFAGPTAGYLLSFPLLAWLVALVFGALTRSYSSPRPLGVTQFDGVSKARSSWWRAPQVLVTIASCLVASYLTTHLLGIAGMVLRVPMTAHDAFLSDMVFLPGDVVKTSAATLVALAVLKGFPQLKRLNRPDTQVAASQHAQVHADAPR